MPKETFLNLPKDKQNKIIEAIKGEFARMPFEKVSINKIVQKAGISRGSFYMYFYDLEDALSTVLTAYNDELASTVVQSCKVHKGDIFEVFIDILNFTADFGTTKENINFCMNVFTYQKLHSYILKQFSNRSSKNQCLNWLIQYIDTEKLNLQFTRDLGDILDILTSITQKAVVDIFLYIDQKEDILFEYKNKINILKRGMLINKPY